ncbi:Adenylate cyclase [Labilithrix luteola]|uniref:Adenylate cyclase n=1 Tax=Labilithrix luteola TaxID=1391654 RepID=A0A0K1PKF5_9BACT|nr:CHAD domain-containing protein [Labilithrix luteola]AKU93589.1 Adenylate cyclase [Labilithrix luteola]
MRSQDPIGPAFATAIEENLAKLKKRLKLAKRGDPAGIHDARTTIRRLRTALTVMAEANLDRTEMLASEDELHEIERILSKPRAADVLLGMVRKQQRRTREPLSELAEKLEGRSRRARKKARRGLRGVKRVIARLHERSANLADAFVEERSPKNPTKAVPLRISQMTHSALFRRYEAVLAYEGLTRSRDPDVLHHIRTECRRLRYAIELFGRSLPNAKIIVDDLRAIQDRVGKMHDHHVAAGLVGKWVDVGKLDDSPPFVHFVDHEKAKVEALRRRAPPRIEAVLAPRFRQRLEAVLDHRL